MAVTNEMEKMASTAQDVAEKQQAAYGEAMENFLAFQRRGMDFAEGGLKLMEMNQSNFKAAQKWWADGFKLAQRQQRTVKSAGDWMSGGFESVRSQTDQNLKTFDNMAENVRLQQESVQTFADAWMNSYREFFAPFVDQAEKNVKAVKNTTNGSRR